MATQPLLLPSKGYQNFLLLKNEYGVYGCAEFDPLIEGLPGPVDDVVEGLLPARSVNLLVGDSGIGKSALAYQLAMSVAAAIPFLDLPVRQGPGHAGAATSNRVLLIDYENSPMDARSIMDRQRRHLQLDAYPKTMQVWPMHLNPLRDIADVEEVCTILAPDLVIIDSLRSFHTGMESDNHTAVEQIKKLRAIAGECGTSFLLIHHVRKTRGTPPSETSAMDWLLRTAGVRSLINQTDARLAVTAQAGKLILRGHYRTRGEIQPILMRRSGIGSDGHPLGYERMRFDPTGLKHAEQEACFERLPATFTLRQARLAYGKSGEAMRLFLNKLLALGLVRKSGLGKYCKEGCAQTTSISE